MLDKSKVLDGLTDQEIAIGRLVLPVHYFSTVISQSSQFNASMRRLAGASRLARAWAARSLRTEYRATPARVCRILGDAVLAVHGAAATQPGAEGPNDATPDTPAESCTLAAGDRRRNRGILVIIAY